MRVETKCYTKDREIDGNLSPELEAKVWEKRMPQLSEEEKLAVEFDRLCFDYDRILYHDTVRNMSENVEEQNYNMIDNVLNNGAEKAKKEADRKEMDKPYGRVSQKERLAEKKAIIAGDDKAAETQENVKKNQREM